MDNLIIQLLHKSNVYKVEKKDVYLQLLSHNDYDNCYICSTSLIDVDY